MRTVKNKKEKNLQVPGEPISQAEFIKLIRKAEKGPFMTLDELKDNFNQWLTQRKKK